MLKVKWPEFKAFVDQKSLSIQYVEFSDRYWLYAFDGSFYIWCRIRTEDPTNEYLVDFEDNYKDNGNQAPKSEVVSQLEKPILTLKACCHKATTSNQEVTLEFKIPGTYGITYREIGGGEAWFAEPHKDDHITELSVVDKENILGLGAGVVVKTYHDEDVSGYQSGGWYLKDKSTITTLTGFGKLPGQLYLRIRATKGGASEDDFFVNIKWGEAE